MADSKALMSAIEPAVMHYGSGNEEYRGLSGDAARLKLVADAQKGILDVLFGQTLIKIRPDKNMGSRGNEGTEPVIEQLVKQVREGLRSQVIITMGQSGAGKTTSMKQILLGLMAEFTDLFQEVEEILSIIKPFINAPTEANPDSTRSICKITVSFHDAALNGVEIGIQALQATRVTQQVGNFHVFDNLVNGSIVNNNPLRTSLSRLFDPSDLDRVINQLKAIALLNELDIFGPDDDFDGHKLAEQLSPVASLLECSPMDLAQHLGWVAGGKEPIPLDATKRKSRKNGFAAGVYSELVTCILHRVNEKLGSGFDKTKEETAHITLLDIPGAENFEENTFETFIINWINEFVQDQAGGIVAENIGAQHQGIPCSTVIGHTLPFSNGLAKSIQDYTRSPMTDPIRWASSLVSAVNNGVAEGANPQDILLEHYSGTKNYTLSGFKDGNATPFSASASSLFDQIFSFAHLGPSPQAHKTVVLSTQKVMTDLRHMLSEADSRWIVCCIKDITDQAELSHIDIDRYIALMFPTYPYSMSIQAFSKDHMSGGVSANPDQITAQLRSLGFPDKSYHVVEQHIYLSSDLYRALATNAFVNHDPNQAAEESLYFPLEQYDLAPGQEAVVESLEEDLEASREENLVLSSQVTRYRSEMTKMQTNINLLTIDAASKDSEIASLTTKLYDLEGIKEVLSSLQRDHQALADTLSATESELQSAKTTIVATQGKLDHTTSQLQRSMSVTETQNLSIVSLTAEKDDIANHHKNLDLQYTATIRRSKLLQESLDISQAAHLDNLHHYVLGKFNLLSENGNVSKRIPYEARRLGRALAPLKNHPSVFERIRAGVIDRTNSVYPSSTILPLIYILQHMENSANGSNKVNNGLSAQEWNTIRGAAIEKFQSAFIDGTRASLQSHGPDIRASTIVARIKELIDPVVGMTDIAAVLEPPIGRFLSMILGKEGAVHQKLNKEALMIKIQACLEEYENVDLTWIKKYLRSAH